MEDFLKLFAKECDNLKNFQFNIPHQLSKGPICKCSISAKSKGINHGFFIEEDSLGSEYFTYSYHINPTTNYDSKDVTTISYLQKSYEFVGFNIISPIPVQEFAINYNRYNIDHSLSIIKQDNLIQGLNELNWINMFLINNILDLPDWNDYLSSHENKKFFWFLPKFICRHNPNDFLPPSVILQYLERQLKPLFQESNLEELYHMNSTEWEQKVRPYKGTIVCNPLKKPHSIRLDQLDRDYVGEDVIGNNVSINNLKTYPKIIHISLNNTQTNYTSHPQYHKTWKQYCKLKHLLSTKAVTTEADHKKLRDKERELEEIKEDYMNSNSNNQHYRTIEISSEGYYATGLKTDFIQQALVLPIISLHMRFIHSLNCLQKSLDYQFKDLTLLRKAMTHPSFKPHYGTNPDHIRNTMSNCGLRNPVYGDKIRQISSSRKRGIVTLNKIMKLKEDTKNAIDYWGNEQHHSSKVEICHNERLEFLGDAVVEFLTSVHLFYMFPYLEEGGLAVYRGALVQNAHLTVLAQKLHLDDYMLYAHGPDLCHDSDLHHAMSNAFEALLGALYLDGGIEVADKLLAKCLYGFGEDPRLFKVWSELTPLPLQISEPNGDRHWIEKSELLSRLTQFEQEIGVKFKHIRILARAFTLRNTGYTNLTLGHNQRLEFLGDTILQLITSDYLYKHFPFHHEGHLSLLRSCLVNNQTQSEVCKDLALHRFVISNIKPILLSTKDKADLLEAFLGALFVDQGFETCRVIFKVCFLGKLDYFIESQGWNDPKSLLQQCCLTLRKMDGKEPDVPIYRVLECVGPSNYRRYEIGVYFRGNRLAVGQGKSKQQAEMAAAQNALVKYKSVFPQFAHLTANIPCNTPQDLH